MKKVMLFVLCSLLAAFTCGTVYAQAAETADMPQINCKAVYLCDWHTGTVMHEFSAEKHLPIASMCKIMTLLVCFDELGNGRFTLDDQVCVSETASGMGGSQVFLEAGAQYPAGELIKSICIASANDSCVAMAEFLYGSETAFVNKMNECAKALGMQNTEFTNCTGLPKAGQYSCAKDVAAMLSALLHHKEYFTFSTVWMDEIEHPGGRKTEMANTNKLIRFYQGCDAGKTGFTSDAGFCLAASAERGNMRVISVVIGADASKTRFDGCRTMFDYAFANYTNKAVVQEGVLPNELCAVTGGKVKAVSVKASAPLFVFAKKGAEGTISCKTVYGQVKAPVRAGDKVGEIVVYKDNIETARTDLLAAENVDKVSYLDSIRDIADNWVI